MAPAQTRRVTVRLTPSGRLVLARLDERVDAPKAGARVVVDADLGASVGTVIRPNGDEPVSLEMARLLRTVTPEDQVTRLKHEHREREAHRVAFLKVRELGLAMKLTRVEQLFDGSKLVFYFTADARVDFRELVRELAAAFRMRIEMRQIGVRDEARMVGGFGTCGRPICCTTFIESFEPVSIKMAKKQDLSLNPAKLSGLCGRLKCCLRFELGSGAPRDAHPGAGHGGGCCGDCGSGGCRQSARR